MRKYYIAVLGLLAFVGVVSLCKSAVKDVLTKIFFLSCFLLFVAGCGKVTQVTSPDTDAPVFDLSYVVPLVPTSQVTPGMVSRTVTANVFSLHDVPLYTAVQGIAADGVVSELSWGRAELREQAMLTATTNVVTYRSLSFRKDGVEIERSDYKWATLGLSPRADQWAVQVAKVKHGYPLYLLSVYSPRGVLSLRVLPHAVVSGNVQVTVPPLTAYDTFVAVMYLTALSEKPQQPLRVLPSEIQRVFTPEFFMSMRYVVPTESAKLDLASPVWSFDRLFEKRLLAYFYLVRGNEPKVAAALLPALEKEFSGILTPKSVRILSDSLSSQNAAQR